MSHEATSPKTFIYEHVSPDLWDGESLENYKPGGFHSVHPGDIYNETYKVIHKLSFGSKSTVWLAEDLRHQITFEIANYINRTGLAVALKILAHGKGVRELNVMLRLKNCLSHPGADNIVQLLDHFYHSGPNGTHLCLVLELMWQDLTVFMSQFNYKPVLRVSVAREISKQILEGVNFLQRRGAIHNGKRTHSQQSIMTDLHPRNILVGFQPARWRVSDIYPFTLPKIFELPTTVGSGNRPLNPSVQMVTRYSSLPIGFPNGYVVRFEDLRIKISDFDLGKWFLLS